MTKLRELRTQRVALRLEIGHGSGLRRVNLGHLRKHALELRLQRVALRLKCRLGLVELRTHALDVLLALAKLGLKIRAHRRQLRVASGRKVGELRTQRVALRLEIGHGSGLRRVNLGHLRKHALELRLQRVALRLKFCATLFCIAKILRSLIFELRNTGTKKVTLVNVLFKFDL